MTPDLCAIQTQKSEEKTHADKIIESDGESSKDETPDRQISLKKSLRSSYHSQAGMKNDLQDTFMRNSISQRSQGRQDTQVTERGEREREFKPVNHTAVNNERKPFISTQYVNWLE